LLQQKMGTSRDAIDALGRVSLFLLRRSQLNSRVIDHVLANNVAVARRHLRYFPAQLAEHALAHFQTAADCQRFRVLKNDPNSLAVKKVTHRHSIPDDRERRCLENAQLARLVAHLQLCLG
jgi:hypothetical protein